MFNYYYICNIKWEKNKTLPTSLYLTKNPDINNNLTKAQEQIVIDKLNRYYHDTIVDYSFKYFSTNAMNMNNEILQENDDGSLSDQFPFFHRH